MALCPQFLNLWLLLTKWQGNLGKTCDFWTFEQFRALFAVTFWSRNFFLCFTKLSDKFLRLSEKTNTVCHGWLRKITTDFRACQIKSYKFRFRDVRPRPTLFFVMMALGPKRQPKIAQTPAQLDSSLLSFFLQSLSPFNVEKVPKIMHNTFSTMSKSLAFVEKWLANVSKSVIFERLSTFCSDVLIA